MSKDHIIPRFILRGFAINPSSSKANQKVMVNSQNSILIMLLLSLYLPYEEHIVITEFQKRSIAYARTF